LLSLALAIPAANLTAAEPLEPGTPPAAAIAAPNLGPIQARVSGALHERTNLKLRTAHRLAVSRLRELPGCRALFEQLGADGVEKLANTIYYKTTPREEEKACRLGAVALTMVGSPQTRLCLAFGELATCWAAMLLIHEALHFAGMSEKPLDPRGLSAVEINELVMARCRF
jgi:hypothetical protein